MADNEHLLEAALASLRLERDCLCGAIRFDILDAEATLIVETTEEPTEQHVACIQSFLRMSEALTAQMAEAMYRFHCDLREDIDDLDVELSEPSQVWRHTRPQYVIIEDPGPSGNTFYRLHFICDWETGHGVEAVVRNGTDLVFLGQCGDAGPLSRLETDPSSEYNYA